MEFILKIVLATEIRHKMPSEENIIFQYIHPFNYVPWPTSEQREAMGMFLVGFTFAVTALERI